jgi:hypothetical protein
MITVPLVTGLSTPVLTVHKGDALATLSESNEKANNTKKFFIAFSSESHF